jgi:Zn-dependent protease
LDLGVFLQNVSIWLIPILLAVTLHEVAHGWMARYLGDRTAEMLGRLSLNPLRHIDPIGTVLIPGLLLAIGGPLFGWAKPVPVATSALPNPRRAAIWVALAGPAANLAMAVAWCAVLALVAQIDGNKTLIYWIALMARAGILMNVFLAVLNLLPVPPLDGGRIVAALLPPPLGARLEKIEPFGPFIVVGLMVLPVFRPVMRVVFGPVLSAVGHMVTGLFGYSA